MQHPFASLSRLLGLVLLVISASPPVWAQCTVSEAEIWADVIVYNGYRYKDIGGAGGSYARQLAATRMHNDDYCASYVQSEAWMNPGGIPGVITNGKGTPNWAVGYKYGNLWGIWTGDTKHWYVNWLASSESWQWIYMGSLHSIIDLGSPPEPTREEQCAIDGGEWDYGTEHCVYQNCPIILDADGNGYHLAGMTDGVLFDINADGVKDSVGWTRSGDLDGFLAIDRNGNGVIDNGSELFGTATRLRNGRLARNGFEALADLDDNHDGKIDDAVLVVIDAQEGII